MSKLDARVNRKEFDEIYNVSILNREFVESPQYYLLSRERYWSDFRRISRLGLGAGTRTLEIGGGIMAVLLSRLLGHDAHVGDVNQQAAGDVRALGLSFTTIDLMYDTAAPAEAFDLVVLTEVIEHIPQPPYIVLGRIARFLRPGGVLYLTTPNGHRIRNVLYMLAGKEVLGIYRYPEPGEVLGHQHEYTMQQMLWQVERGGFEVIASEYCENGWPGASLWARVARIATKAAAVVPHFREALVIVARRQSDSP